MIPLHSAFALFRASTTRRTAIILSLVLLALPATAPLAAQRSLSGLPCERAPSSCPSAATSVVAGAVIGAIVGALWSSERGY